MGQVIEAFINDSHQMMGMKSKFGILLSPEILLKKISLSSIILSRSLTSIFF